MNSRIQFLAFAIFVFYLAGCHTSVLAPAIVRVESTVPQVIKQLPFSYYAPRVRPPTFPLRTVLLQPARTVNPTLLSHPLPNNQIANGNEWIVESIFGTAPNQIWLFQSDTDWTKTTRLTDALAAMRKESVPFAVTIKGKPIAVQYMQSDDTKNPAYALLFKHQDSFFAVFWQQDNPTDALALINELTPLSSDMLLVTTLEGER